MQEITNKSNSQSNAQSSDFEDWEEVKREPEESF